MLNRPAVDTTFTALGDQTRRAIIEQLSFGTAAVSELAEPLQISRSAVLQHLQLLEEARLVTTRKQGRVRTCELNPEGLQAARSWIEERQALWERRLDRLGELLEEEEGRRS